MSKAEDRNQDIAPNRTRYAKLAHMDIDTETKLAGLARSFFSPMFQSKTRKLSPGQPLTPASGKDFMDFLGTNNGILDEPNKYIYQIRGLLDRMAANNILVDMGVGRDGFVMLPKSYYALSENSTLREQGVLWLAKTLGGRFIHRQISPAVVHVIGENNEGEGSGIVFDAHHVLTCKHVVSDMNVATDQTFQGKTVQIDQIFPHGTEDVAVIRVKESFAVLGS